MADVGNFIFVYFVMSVGSAGLLVDVHNSIFIKFKDIIIGKIKVLIKHDKLIISF